MRTLASFALSLAVLFYGGEASALTASQAFVANAAPNVIKVYHRYRGGHYAALFRHWCSYNCYAVSPCYRGGCLGRYGYSRYAYDQDLPFRYRYDRDASPIDNGLALTYPVTGEWSMRLFERRY